VTLLVLAAVALLPAYSRAYKLTGPSDIPTVLLGDTVIVNRVAYVLQLPYTDVTISRTGSPKRGDLALMRLRNYSMSALNPADFGWVPKAHPIGSMVMNEDGHWVTFTPGRSAARNLAATRLGDGQYFVLGDNRDDSEDSREFGPVARDVFLGKVIATFATGERAK
jgi:signal peptidase I